MRLRITFAKTEAMRYTGHLDLHRAWERTLRRAALPLIYSQGYTPRPKINLASALPLGITSQCEMVEVWLEGELPLDEIQTSLERTAPPGLEIVSIETADIHEPKLQVLLQSAEYIVAMLTTFPALGKEVEAVLNALHLPRERRGKTYDLRPLVQKLRSMDLNEKGQQRLHMRLAAREGATGRPGEVLDEMGIPIQDVQIQRTALIFRQP